MTTSVSVAQTPDLAEKRRAFLLAEDRVGHYSEFRASSSRRFDLDTLGLQRPGYVRAPSGIVYALVFVGRSGEPFPSGVEVNAIVDALEPLDETIADRDLWAILEWMIAGVGGDWTARDLQATGRLYRLPAVSP